MKVPLLSKKSISYYICYSLLALTMTYRCNKAKDYYHLKERIHPTTTSERGNSESNKGSLISPFTVYLNEKNYDLSKIGIYHNELLSYATNDTSIFNYVNDSLLMSFTRSEINLGIASIASIDSLITPYFFTPNDPDHKHPLIGLGLAEAPIDSLIKYLKFHIDQVYAKGGVNLNEKNLLYEFVDDFSQNSVDYQFYKEKWSEISGKPYNGAFSASFLIVGAYSTDWWITYFDGIDPEGPTDAFIAFAMADLGGAVFGYSRYMIKNWSDHYLSDFGINAVRAGGDMAAEWSVGSLFGRFK